MGSSSVKSVSTLIDTRMRTSISKVGAPSHKRSAHSRADSFIPRRGMVQTMLLRALFEGPKISQQQKHNAQHVHRMLPHESSCVLGISAETAL